MVKSRSRDSAPVPSDSRPVMPRACGASSNHGRPEQMLQTPVNTGSPAVAGDDKARAIDAVAVAILLWERGGRSSARPVCARVNAAGNRALSSAVFVIGAANDLIMLKKRANFFRSRKVGNRTERASTTFHSPMILKARAARRQLGAPSRRGIGASIRRSAARVRRGRTSPADRICRPD